MPTNLKIMFTWGVHFSFEIKQLKVNVFNCLEWTEFVNVLNKRIWEIIFEWIRDQNWKYSVAFLWQQLVMTQTFIICQPTKHILFISIWILWMLLNKWFVFEAFDFKESRSGPTHSRVIQGLLPIQSCLKVKTSENWGFWLLPLRYAAIPAAHVPNPLSTSGSMSPVQPISSNYTSRMSCVC